MQASSPMSPESRPKRGSRKLTSEKQDLPGNGSRAVHVGRARLDAAEAVAPRCGGSSGWRAHDEACHSDALGLVGLLGQVGVVGAHVEAGGCVDCGVHTREVRAYGGNLWVGARVSIGHGV